MPSTFLERTKITTAFDAAAAGTTDTLTSIVAVDTSDSDEVTIVIDLGDNASGAVGTLSLLSVATNATSGGTLITGAQVAFTATATNTDKKCFAVTAKKNAITAKYVYATFQRATANFVVKGGNFFQTNYGTLPVTQVDCVATATAAK